MKERMNDVVSDEVIIRVVLIVIELSDRNMIFDEIGRAHV